MQNNVRYDHINVIITTTYFCNMNCVYCYNNRDIHEKKTKIAIDTVRKLYEITIPYYKYIHFLWHGGEPLSLGLEFYKEVIELQRELNVYGTEITNAIQTNLTLLDEEMAKFAVENHISIGSSYDGTTNESTRHLSNKILEGHKLLKTSKGHNGFICVVQSKNVDHLMEDYEWFKTNHIGYSHNMYLASQPYEEDPLFVDPAYCAQKMCELFDVWIYDKNCNIHLSYFETFLEFLLLHRKSICCYNNCIGKHIGVRPNGDIYGCNRDLPEEFSFGNVHDYSNIRECFESPGCNNYLKQAIKRRKKCMDTCAIYDFCHGGCNSVALQNGTIENNNPPSCLVLNTVYRHIERRVNELAGKTQDELRKVLNPLAFMYFKKEK